jgi:hypothetical protein
MASRGNGKIPTAIKAAVPPVKTARHLPQAKAGCTWPQPFDADFAVWKAPLISPAQALQRAALVRFAKPSPCSPKAKANAVRTLSTARSSLFKTLFDGTFGRHPL